MTVTTVLWYHVGLYYATTVLWYHVGLHYVTTVPWYHVGLHHDRLSTSVVTHHTETGNPCQSRHLLFI